MKDKGEGGLTGVTGSLTPSDPDDEFVPAETREISDPQAARRITAETYRRAEDRGAHQADAGGPEGGGYGTGSGLNEEDPAYRMEERAMPPRQQPRGPDPQLGGDERGDPEAEHL